MSALSHLAATRHATLTDALNLQRALLSVTNQLRLRSRNTMSSSSMTPIRAGVVSTCDLFDEYEETAKVPVVCWRNLGGKKQFCGTAVTVKCFEDNSRVKELAETDGANRVMVIDGGGSCRHALMGDMLAERAAQNKWSGVIVYGCVRDVEALGNISLGVQALGTTPRKSVRRGEGKVDLAIRIGDVNVHPGDLVFADEDGVIFLDPKDVKCVL